MYYLFYHFEGTCFFLFQVGVGFLAQYLIKPVLGFFIAMVCIIAFQHVCIKLFSARLHSCLLRFCSTVLFYSLSSRDTISDTCLVMNS